MDQSDYIKKNRESWNQRIEYHLKSDFYDLNGFINGKSSLNDIELNLLGDISGKTLLHLQCHFGQDTLSLERLGCTTTGVDFSDKAIETAKLLTDKIGLSSKFICCDIYDLPNHLNKKYNVVYTSYGTIGWLPDLDKWARIINAFLTPGGKFIFIEFHPAVWMFDDDLKEIKYNYFNTEPIIETLLGTYADRDAPIKSDCIQWNHSISEVVNSLIKNGLEIKKLDEYDYSPYDIFEGTEKIENHKYRIKKFGSKLPLIYSIEAVKKIRV